MPNNSKTLFLLILALVVVFAIGFLADALTAKPPCPNGTIMTFGADCKFANPKDHTGATATVAAMTQEAP